MIRVPVKHGLPWQMPGSTVIGVWDFLMMASLCKESNMNPKASQASLASQRRGREVLVALIGLGVLLGVAGSAEAAARYWIAGSAANWNDTANWSTASAGAGGSSVPGSADIAYFDGGGLGGESATETVQEQ